MGRRDWLMWLQQKEQLNRLVAPLAGASIVGALLGSCSTGRSATDGANPMNSGGQANGAASAETGGSLMISLPDGGSAGSNRDPSVCADVEVTTTRTIPTVAFVVEQSNGMDLSLEDGQPLTRWEALKDVLLAPDAGVIPSLESEIRMGLVLYANPPPYFPECPDITDVMPPVLNNYAAIEAVYGTAETIPNAPTGDGLRAATAQLETVTETGPKYLVLGTNGDPDRCDENGGQVRQDDESKALVVSAAQEAYAKGIQTFVINVGRGPTARAHLQAVANAGAGLAPDAAPGAVLYEPGTREELAEALQDLVGTVKTCSFDLRGEVDLNSAHRGTVTLDGTPLSMSDEDGWRLITKSRLELVGSACTTLKDGNHELRAKFPCDVVVVR